MILSAEHISGSRHPVHDNMDKYIKIVELTTPPASNHDDNISFSKLILDKLSMASDQLGLTRAEDTSSDIIQLSIW
jgi:hypothetical protein